MTTDAGNGAVEGTVEQKMVLESTFERFPLDQFHLGHALWAANFFVLWPLGIALSVNFDKDTKEYSDLHVREWVFPDGKVETINLNPDENTEAYQVFLQWALQRVLKMKPSERRLALTRLGQFEILNAQKLLLVGDDE